MNPLRPLVFLAAAAVLTLATSSVAAPPEAIDVATLKDKVSVTLGQERWIRFTPQGDRLVAPRSVKGAGEGTVEIQLLVTDATPTPVKGDPRRPYVVVTNGFKQPLGFRVATRLKGSKEFLPLDDKIKPAGAGDNWMHCWMSGSQVEEVVVYQFTLLPKPAK